MYRHGQPYPDSHSTMRVWIRLPMSVHNTVSCCNYNQYQKSSHAIFVQVTYWKSWFPRKNEKGKFSIFVNNKVNFSSRLFFTYTQRTKKSLVKSGVILKMTWLCFHYWKALNSSFSNIWSFYELRLSKNLRTIIISIAIYVFVAIIFVSCYSKKFDLDYGILDFGITLLQTGIFLLK